MSPHELQTSILNESLDNINLSTSSILQFHNDNAHVHKYYTYRQGQSDRQATHYIVCMLVLLVINTFSIFVVS